MATQQCGAQLELQYTSYQAQFVCQAPLGHDGPHGGPFQGGQMAGKPCSAYILWPYVRAQ